MASFQGRPPHTMLSENHAAVLQYLIKQYGGEAIISRVEATLSTSQSLDANCPTFYNNSSTVRELSPRTSISSEHSSSSTLSHRTSTSSATSVSDASSISFRGSVHSDISMPERPSATISQSPHPGYPSSTQKGSLQARAATNALAAAIAAANALHAAQKKSSHACPFCEEYSISLTCGRRSDLKKHLIDFHNHDVQWHCPFPECDMIFDVKSAFERHVKNNHPNFSVQAEQVMVRTCPQVVFACGFANCRYLIEADGDVTAKDAANKYFGHVASHFDDHGNNTGSRWSYRIRFRNLMRQSLVDSAWKNRTKGYQPRGWQPQTSTILRKMLETRHIHDVHQLVQYAAVLDMASNALTQTYLPPELFVPTPDRCPLAAHLHNPDHEGEWPLEGGKRFASPASTRPVTPAQFNYHPLIKVPTLVSQPHLMRSPSHSTVTSPAESTVMGVLFPQPPQIRFPSPSAATAAPAPPADASFATGHPLALFHGYRTERASQLPQGADVIADLDKRIEEHRPMTAAQLAAVQLQQDLQLQRHPQQHQLASVYGGHGDDDVDMSGYAAGPFFNLL